MAIDWDRLRFPKRRPAKPTAPSPKPKARPKIRTTKRRAAKNRKARKVAADDRGQVFDRQQGVCFAAGISPVCTRRCQHPHELIPVSRGGPRKSWNRVGLCPECHAATDATLGGRKLHFHWPGKADGTPPNADTPGNVWATWTGAATA